MRLKFESRICGVCSTPFMGATLYCSKLCGKRAGRKKQHAQQYSAYIVEWKQGRVDGMRGEGQISLHIRRYLLDKFSGRCAVCGWCEVHPLTLLVPVEVDHIDGDWRNNKEENLRLLCPNHHALTPTYRNLNYGRGRFRRGHPMGDGA